MTAPNALRPGDQTPAGGARTWRVELPAGMPLLNANHRTHWRKKVPITRDIRAAARTRALDCAVPELRRAHITCFYEPPDKRRRDPSNWAPSAKAAVDGLVDAGVLPDDDAEHLDGPDMRLGPVHPRGRLVLIITELDAPDA